MHGRPVDIGGLPNEVAADTSDSTFVGDVQVNAGTLALVRGALSAVQVDVHPGGRFELPGGVLNVDTINGDYWLGNLGSLAVELAGLAQGSEHDFYDVTGIVCLSGGTPDMEMIPPHTLDLGQTYAILRAYSVTVTVFPALAHDSLVPPTLRC